MFVWTLVQVFTLLGLIFPASRSFALFIRELWMSAMWVPVSTSYQKWADYNALGVFNLQYLVCDKIMYKYWLFHFFN